MDRRLTVKEAAAHFGGGVMRVYRRIYAGDLKAIDIRLPGSDKPLYRIAESEIDRYFAARNMKPPPSRTAAT